MRSAARGVVGGVLLVALAVGVGVGGGGAVLRHWLAAEGAPRLERLPGEPCADRSGAEVLACESERLATASASREVERPDPLAGLDDIEALRRLERRGRRRFGGQVVDESGRPAPDVALFVDGKPAGRSDADGFWSIEVDAFSGQPLTARDERLGVAVTLLEPPSRRIDLRLERGVVIRGRAIGGWNREPIAGVRVFLRVDPKERLQSGRVPTTMELETTSGADGRFAFAALPRRPSDLRAESRNADTPDTTVVDFDDMSTACEVELELDRRVPVKGWFKPWPPHGADAKAPLRVVARSEHDREVEVGADGWFEIALAPFDRWGLELVTAGRVLWRHSLPLPRDSPPIDLGRIELVEPSTVTGRVAAGAAADGFALQLFGSIRDGDDLALLEQPIAADGSFTIGPIAMSRCSFEVRPAGRTGGVRFGRWEGEVARGATIDVGCLDPQGAFVTGRIVDREGHGLCRPQVRVGTVALLDRIDDRGWESADRDGRFLIDVNSSWISTSEPFVLEVAGDDFRMRSEPFASDRRGSLGDLVIGVGRTLRGRARWPDGSPAAGFCIRLHGSLLRPLESCCSADGSFEFLGVPEGELHASALGFDSVRGGWSWVAPSIAADVTEVDWTVVLESER